MKANVIIATILLLASEIAAMGQTTAGAGATQLIPGPVVQWGNAAGGNGHYYQAIQSVKGTAWADAKAYANTHGGYLVTVSSPEENKFVFSLIDDAKYWTPGSRGTSSFGPWIGAVKSPAVLRPEDGWEWANGEGPVTYFNWARNQPDFDGGKENRILYYDDATGVRVDKWNDCGSFAAHGFVVEYKSNPAVANPTAPADSGDMLAVVIMALIFALIILIGVIVLVFRGKKQRRGTRRGKSVMNGENTPEFYAVVLGFDH